MEITLVTLPVKDTKECFSHLHDIGLGRVNPTSLFEDYCINVS